MSSHSRTNGYNCNLCREQFEEKKELINQQVTKHCKCSYCGSQFNNKNEIDDHICMMHPYKTIQEQRRTQRRKNTVCTLGQYCHHNRKGKCMFKHSPNQSSFPQEGQGNHIESEAQNGTRQPVCWLDSRVYAYPWSPRSSCLQYSFLLLIWNGIFGHVGFTLPGNYCIRMAAASPQQPGMANHPTCRRGTHCTGTWENNLAQHQDGER